MTHKARADLESAYHTLTHPRRKVEEPTKERHAVRRFHVDELHDGSYHVEKDHGVGPPETGSATDLDEVHDHLEEMMGGPNEGEEVEHVGEHEKTRR
jgi:hypothetical protein